MKLVSIFFDAAIEDVVQDALKKDGITCYVKVPRLLGRMGNCEPLLDTHVWPGYAVWYLIPLEQHQLEKCGPTLKVLREEYSDKGFKAFIFQVEEIP
jgi:hypothetical protein